MRPARALAVVLVLVVLGVAWFLVIDSDRSRERAGEPPAIAPAAEPAQRAESASLAEPEVRVEAIRAPVAPSPPRPPSDRIQGRVVGAPPEQASLLEVQATALDARLPSRNSPCDGEGRFLLAGLTPGTTYHLRTFVRGRASFGRARTETRTAHPGDLEVELPYLAEPVLTFEVVDARSGVALTEFEVRLGRGFARPLLDEEGRVQDAFPAGRVRWTRFLPDEETDSLDLVISARGYGELRRDVLAPLGSELDLGRLGLEPVPRLVVHVQDADTGQAIRGALVTLECRSAGARPGGQAFDPYSGRTDAEGRVLLTSLPGQDCLLRVQHPQHLALERPLALGLGEQQSETVELRRR